MSIKPNEVKLTNERNNDGAFNLRKPLPKEVSFPFLKETVSSKVYAIATKQINKQTNKSNSNSNQIKPTKQTT
ncbi:MAG: hypothetical protein ACTS6G_02680 [Candidatus Hodgkinia cicadicola]